MKLRIEELCRRRGLRMSDIAAKMGVNQANLTSSLKGNPTISRLEAVANVLGVVLQTSLLNRLLPAMTYWAIWNVRMEFIRCQA